MFTEITLPTSEQFDKVASQSQEEQILNCNPSIQLEWRKEINAEIEKLLLPIKTFHSTKSLVKSCVAKNAMVTYSLSVINQLIKTHGLKKIFISTITAGDRLTFLTFIKKAFEFKLELKVLHLWTFKTPN